MDDGRSNCLKADRIIEAAMKEFAEKGYEKASTEQICRNAEVSKGLLFHHFGTKKGLYLEVYERIISGFMEKLSTLNYDDCETYLESIVKTSQMKLDYFIQNPQAYDIMLETQYSTPNGIEKEIKGIFNKYVDMDLYFSDMVFGRYKFREGVDPHKAWEVMQAVTSLVERKIISKVVLDNERKMNVEKIMDLSDELFEYFDIIFNGIAETGAKFPKRGWARENDNDGKGRFKAV